MSTPPSQLRSFVCPTCGAPLEVKADEPTIHCQYCNATVENPEYHPPKPARKPQTIKKSQPTYPTPQVAKRSGAVTYIVVVVLLLLIGGGILLFKSFLSNSLFPQLIANPIILLNSNTQSPNMIAPVYEPSGDKHYLARLDISNHNVIWKSLNQNDSLHIDAMVAGDTLLYLIMKDRLIALNLTDGTQTWEATLPDSLSGSCPSCLQVKKGQVIVYTNDKSLGAYEALSGHQTWEKNFDTGGYDLYSVGDAVALTYLAQKGTSSGILGIFDVTNGNELTQIEPTCESSTGLSDGMDQYMSKFVFDSPSQPTKVYIYFGFFNSCIQSWDLSSGMVDWHDIADGETTSNPDNRTVLLADGTLFYYQDDQLLSLDVVTGTQLKVIDTQKDYTLIPLVGIGQNLIVRAEHTSGTRRYELWGYDLQTGKNLWKRPLLQNSPLDPPDEMIGFIEKDQSGWTFQAASGKFWLITFQAQPHQVNLSQINLDTGELVDQKILPLSLDKVLIFTLLQHILSARITYPGSMLMIKSSPSTLFQEVYPTAGLDSVLWKTSAGSSPTEPTLRGTPE